MTKSIQLASQLIPTSMPGPTPRLRPAQAAPVRRETVPAGRDDPGRGGGSMSGITPSQPKTYSVSDGCPEGMTEIGGRCYPRDLVERPLVTY